MAGNTLVGGVAVLAFGATGILTQGFPDRLPTKAASLLATARLPGAVRQRCHFSGPSLPAPDSECMVGVLYDQGVAVLGDSHAAMLSDSLSAMLRPHGLHVLSLTYSSCPPVTGLYKAEDASSRCHEFNEIVSARVLSDARITHVVLAARWTLYLEKRRFDNGEGGKEPGRDVWLDEIRDGRRITNAEDRRKAVVQSRYENTVRRLVDAGKTVVLVYPIPEVGHDVPARMARAMMLGLTADEKELTTSNRAYEERNKSVTKVFDRIDVTDKLIRVRPANLFCGTTSPERCETQRRGLVYYADTHHLSTAGASMVAERITASITRVSP
jgi:hypothetical protein